MNQLKHKIETLNDAVSVLSETLQDENVACVLRLISKIGPPTQRSNKDLLLRLQDIIQEELNEIAFDDLSPQEESNNPVFEELIDPSSPQLVITSSEASTFEGISKPPYTQK